VRWDFEGVIGDLKRAGCPVEFAWFAPFFAFGFPIFRT
jgi:uncharacterized protein (DUF2126 family)